MARYVRDNIGRFSSVGKGSGINRGNQQKTIVNKGERSRRTALRRKQAAALSGNRVEAKGGPRPPRSRGGKLVVTRVAKRYLNRVKRQKAKGVRRGR